MDRVPAADLQLDQQAPHRLPGAAQSELLVELRLARRDHAGGADHHRRGAGDALHAACRSRLRFGRAHHARRGVGLAHALPPRQRRLDVLRRGLHPPLPRPLLRLLQVAARDPVVDGRHHPAAHDGERLHGLRAAVGADELLGGDGDHQHDLGDPVDRRDGGDLAVGRLLGRSPHARPLLCAALPAAVRALRRGLRPPLGAAPSQVEQPARHRHQERQGHHPLPPVLHGEGLLRHRGDDVHPVDFRLLHAERAGRGDQLREGEPAADAGPHRAGMVLPAVLRDPPRDPRQARRRRGDGRLDRHPLHPAVAGFLPGPQRTLSPDLQVGVLGLRGGLRRPRLGRREHARRQLHLDRPGHHRLLLRALPPHYAAHRQVRAAHQAAGKHPSGGAQGRRRGRGRGGPADAAAATAAEKS